MQNPETPKPSAVQVLGNKDDQRLLSSRFRELGKYGKCRILCERCPCFIWEATNLKDASGEFSNICSTSNKEASSESRLVRLLF